MTVAQGSLLRVSSSNYSNLGESRVERNYQIFGEPIMAGIKEESSRLYSWLESVAHHKPKTQLESACMS